MRLRSAGRDELLAHEQRKRQVGETTAVDVPELTPAASEFGAAEPMPADRHARPRRHFADDGVVDGLGHLPPSLPGAGPEDAARHGSR